MYHHYTTQYCLRVCICMTRMKATGSQPNVSKVLNLCKVQNICSPVVTLRDKESMCATESILLCYVHLCHCTPLEVNWACIWSSPKLKFDSWFLTWLVTVLRVWPRWKSTTSVQKILFPCKAQVWHHVEYWHGQQPLSTSDYIEHFRSVQDKREIMKVLTSGDPEGRRVHMCYREHNIMLCTFMSLYASGSQLSLLCKLAQVWLVFILTWLVTVLHAWPGWKSPQSSCLTPCGLLTRQTTALHFRLHFRSTQD